MAITLSNNLKLALRTYSDDGTTAASTTRTQIGSSYKVKVYKTSGDVEVASGTASGSLGGSGVNVTGTVTLTGSGAATPGADDLYARVEKSDGSVWIRGKAGTVSDTTADAKLSGPIISGGTITCTLAFDFPATGGGGGGGGGGTSYVPSTPPGTVSRWIRRSTDAGVYVPTTFVGLHRDHGKYETGATYADPAFSYGSLRIWDYSTNNQGAAGFWNNLDSDVNGVLSFTQLDKVLHPTTGRPDSKGKPFLYCRGGTPPTWQRYPGEYYAGYALSGGGSPVDIGDEANLVDLFADLKTYYGSQFKWAELTNEPALGNTLPGTAITYNTTRESASRGEKCFFTGTAQDMVREYKAVYDWCEANGVMLLAGAWETKQYNAADWNYWGAMLNACYRFATCPHPTLPGVYGRNCVHGLSFHHYFTAGTQTANALIQVIADYRTVWFDSDKCAFNSSLPIFLTEIGFLEDRNPTPAFAAAQFKRAGLIAAGAGVQKIDFYKWSDYSTGHMVNPIANTIVGTKLGELHAGVAGKTIRQCAELSTGVIWVECEDGTRVQE